MGVDGSDVYAWADIDGSYRMWACGESIRFSVEEDLHQFMRELKERGLSIPDYAFDPED